MNDRDNTRRRHIGRGTPHAPSCHADARAPSPSGRSSAIWGPDIAHGTLSDPRCNLKPRPAGAGGEWPRRGATVHRPRHPAARVASKPGAWAPCRRMEDRRMGLTVAVRVFPLPPAGRPGRGAGHVCMAPSLRNSPFRACNR